MTVGVTRVILVRGYLGTARFLNTDYVKHVPNPLLIVKRTQIAPVNPVLSFFQCVGGGILRGSGRQVLCACISLVAYYFVGLPMGIPLMFLTSIETAGRTHHRKTHPVHTAPSTALLYSAVSGPVEIGPIPMRATASTEGSKPRRLYCHRSTQSIHCAFRRRHSCQRGTNTIALLCLLCSFSIDTISQPCILWLVCIVWRSDATPGSSGWGKPGYWLLIVR
jgi:hypothetical protein